MLYNLGRFDERTFVSTNDGIAIAGSNCDPVYSGGAIGLTVLRPPCIDLPHPPGDESVVAKIYRTRALDYMQDHASKVPVVMARGSGAPGACSGPWTCSSSTAAKAASVPSPRPGSRRTTRCSPSPIAGGVVLAPLDRRGGCGCSRSR